MFFATIAWSTEKPFDDGTMPTNPFLDDFIRKNNNVGNNDNKIFSNRHGIFFRSLFSLYFVWLQLLSK